MTGKIKQNLHTHTTYCDGKDMPEEMIQVALKKGFQSIGFSGHSYMYYSPKWGMSLEGTEQYNNRMFDYVAGDMCLEIKCSKCKKLIGVIQFTEDYIRSRAKNGEYRI